MRENSFKIDVLVPNSYTFFQLFLLKANEINIWLAIAYKVLIMGNQLNLAGNWREGLFLWEYPFIKRYHPSVCNVEII